MEFYRQIYYQVCDLLLQELQDRFDQQKLLPPVLSMESILIKAANGENYEDSLKLAQDSVYKNDLNLEVIKRQLPLLADVVKEYDPKIKKVQHLFPLYVVS